MTMDTAPKAMNITINASMFSPSSQVCEHTRRGRRVVRGWAGGCMLGRGGPQREYQGGSMGVFSLEPRFRGISLVTSTCAHGASHAIETVFEDVHPPQSVHTSGLDDMTYGLAGTSHQILPRCPSGSQSYCRTPPSFSDPPLTKKCSVACSE